MPDRDDLRTELEGIATLLCTIRENVSLGTPRAMWKTMEWIRARLTEAISRLNEILDVCPDCGGSGEVKTCSHYLNTCPCATEPCGCGRGV